jgi:hypothetical protein
VTFVNFRFRCKMAFLQDDVIQPTIIFPEDHFTNFMSNYDHTTINRYESEVREAITKFISNYHQYVITKQDYITVFEICFFMAHWNKNISGKGWNIQTVGINVACSLAHASLQLTSLPIVQEYLVNIRHIVFNEVYRRHHGFARASMVHFTYVSHKYISHFTTNKKVLNFAETALKERIIIA